MLRQPILEAVARCKAGRICLEPICDVSGELCGFVSVFRFLLLLPIGSHRARPSP